MGRKVWVPVVSGPLALYAAGFEGWLRSRAYSLSAGVDRLCQFDQLSRWLEGEGLGVGELTGEQAERFVAARRAAGRVTWVSLQSVMLPLEYLRWLGVAPTPAPTVVEGPLEELLADYGRYLLVERGLSQHTVLDAFGPAARLFLAEQEAPDGLELERLSAADVSSFLVRESARRSVSGARDLVCRAAVVVALLAPGGVDRGAVGVGGPGPLADLRDRTLPRGLEPAAVRKLLVQLRSAHAGRPARLRNLAVVGAARAAGRRDRRVPARRHRLAGRAAARSWQGRPPRRAAVARRCRRGDRVLSSPSPAVRVPGAVSAGDRAGAGN